MYCVKHQDGGKLQPYNEYRFNNVADAICEATRVASDYVRREYKNSRAGHVSMVAAKNIYKSDAGLYRVHVNHSSKVGSKIFIIDKVEA